MIYLGVDIHKRNYERRVGSSLLAIGLQHGGG
jgi:hypothetical protein